MKRCLPILVFLYLFLPTSNSLAFEGGLIEGKSPTSSRNTYNAENLTDNNLNTYGEIYPLGNVIYEFESPVFISKVYVKYVEPKDTGQTIEFFDASNKRIFSIPSTTLDKINPYIATVDIDNVKFVKINNNNTIYRFRISEIDFYGQDYIEPIQYDEVTNLLEKHDFNSVDLSWTNPANEKISGIVIKQNGVEIKNLSPATETYRITGLSPETTYEYDVIARYSDGGESKSVTVIVTTDSEPPPLMPAGEVTKLKADTKHDRVDLSWALPESDNFKHVIIYRDMLEKNFFDKLLGVATVKAAATPIFETNGTYFNDLTVEPERKYEYTLTTMSTDKIESDGVSVTVTTPKEPDPEIEGGGHEKDPETGDFTYTWSKPNEGEVKVMVGGKLYATVPASDGKITIPAANMKYTFLGKPDVQLTPVSQDGKEGKPVSPPASGSDGGGSSGGVGPESIPFKVNDLVMTTFQIIGLLSGILLIVLAIQLTPRIIAIIKQSIKKRGMVK